MAACFRPIARLAWMNEPHREGGGDQEWRISNHAASARNRKSFISAGTPSPGGAPHAFGFWALQRRRLQQCRGRSEFAGSIPHCNGCDGPFGADQSMVGVFTRVNRTEYTLQIVVRDTQTGSAVSNHFTGLRMGANYAWPRSVKWLMNNRILSAQRAE
jgi:hypothetical protein